MEQYKAGFFFFFLHGVISVKRKILDFCFCTGWTSMYLHCYFSQNPCFFLHWCWMFCVCKMKKTVNITTTSKINNFFPWKETKQSQQNIQPKRPLLQLLLFLQWKELENSEFPLWHFKQIFLYIFCEWKMHVREGKKFIVCNFPYLCTCNFCFILMDFLHAGWRRNASVSLKIRS